MIGKRVRLKESPGDGIRMPKALVGVTGTVTGHDPSPNHIRWHVALDQDVPGFYSGKAWAETDELDVIE